MMIKHFITITAAGAAYQLLNTYITSKYGASLEDSTITTVSGLGSVLTLLFFYGLFNSASLFVKQKLNFLFLFIVAGLIFFLANYVAQKSGTDLLVEIKKLAGL